MLSSNNAILALDVGGSRIGVATANVVARIARPLKTLTNDDAFVLQLQRCIDQELAAVLVVGLPRGLEGQHTEQTRTVEAFVDSLKKQITLPIYWQDEALTSQKAEAELKQRGGSYAKGDIDALAATYILEDFLRDHPEVRA